MINKKLQTGKGRIFGALYLLHKIIKRKNKKKKFKFLVTVMREIVHV
jgi:hypothetical protein